MIPVNIHLKAYEEYLILLNSPIKTRKSYLSIFRKYLEYCNNQHIDDAFTDYINLSTNSTVTGGTLQVGNGATPVYTFNYWINSTPHLYNLTVNTTSTPTAEIRTNITVLNDVTIGTGAGLDASTLNNNLLCSLLLHLVDCRWYIADRY